MQDVSRVAVRSGPHAIQVEEDDGAHNDDGTDPDHSDDDYQDDAARAFQHDSSEPWFSQRTMKLPLGDPVDPDGKLLGSASVWARLQLFMVIL